MSGGDGDGRNEQDSPRSLLADIGSMRCCISHATDSSSKSRLFRFPADPTRRQLWTQNCRRMQPDFVPKDYHRLCEKHFDEAQFESHRADRTNSFPKLRPDAVPLLFDQSVTTPSKKRHKSVIHDEHRYSKKACTNPAVTETRPTIDQPPMVLELTTDCIVDIGNETDDNLSQQAIDRLQLEVRRLTWQLQQSKKREAVLTENIAKYIDADELEKLKLSLEDEDYSDQVEYDGVVDDGVVDAGVVDAVDSHKSTADASVIQKSQPVEVCGMDALDESDIDPNMQQTVEESSEFHVINGGSTKGGQVLVDGQGYRYIVNIRRGERTYWRCCTRSQQHSLCYATAVQSAAGFSLGQQLHSHPPPPDVYIVATARRAIFEQAVENVYEPASNIVTRVLAAIGSDVPLPSAKNLARAAKYHRRRRCHAETQNVPLVTS